MRGVVRESRGVRLETYVELFFSRRMNRIYIVQTQVSKIDLRRIVVTAQSVRVARDAACFSETLCTSLDRTISCVANVLATTAATLACQDAVRVVAATEAVVSLCVKKQDEEKLNEVVLEEVKDNANKEEKVVMKRAFRVSVANGVMGCRKRVQARELTVQDEDTVSNMKERAMKEFKLEKEAEEIEMCRWDRTTQKVTCVEDFQSHVLISLNDEDRVSTQSLKIGSSFVLMEL
mgnify:CR=1 FL=1